MRLLLPPPREDQPPVEVGRPAPAATAWLDSYIRSCFRHNVAKADVGLAYKSGKAHPMRSVFPPLHLFSGSSFVLHLITFSPRSRLLLDTSPMHRATEEPRWLAAAHEPA